jgi:hypothetical protein
VLRSLRDSVRFPTKERARNESSIWRVGARESIQMVIIVRLLVVLALGFAMSSSVWLSSARAGDAGFYDATRMNEADRLVLAWFKEKAVQMCCGEADAFEADDFDQKDGEYIAIVTDGKANMWRPGLPNGTRIRVPNSQIRWMPRNPTGHGVLFVRRGWNAAVPGSIYVYCYFPPTGL